MAERTRGMGRGLAAILSDDPPEARDGVPRAPVELIAPNPHQPRRHFDEDALVGLAASLRTAACSSRCSSARARAAPTS